MRKGNGMKILFLHLSDAHFREDTKFREININAMVNALKQIDKFDECIIVFFWRYSTFWRSEPI